MRKILIFTALYLFCEVTYNLGLVEFLSSKNTTIDTYSNLETFGKLLSAVGFSLILSRLVPARIKFGKVASIAILIPALFYTETFAFNAILDGLPAQTKVYGYMEGVYRNAVLNGNIRDERFSSPLTTRDKVALSSIVATDTHDIQTEVEGFLYTTVPDSTIDGFYSDYQTINTKIDPFYASYALASKRYALLSTKAQQVALAQFKEKTGGIEPGLSQQDFAHELARHFPSYTAYSDTIVIPGNPRVGLLDVRAGDIPLGLSQAAFRDFMKEKLATALSKSRISAANIDNLPHSRDLIASVFIPPLAIALSLLSIILNASSLLASYRKVLGTLPIIVALAIAFSASSNRLAVNEWAGRALNVEVAMATALSPYMRLLHSSFIDDNHPDETNIIRVHKPKAVDFSDIEQKLTALKSEETDMPPVDERLEVDTTKLQDQGYFGRIKTTKNPYTN
ncbi:hypothetical protein AWB71_02550 [Caballeronia peredens]|nr:hypothetical protein AWB71_02550 [Caballeronia peredens]